MMPAVCLLQQTSDRRAHAFIGLTVHMYTSGLLMSQLLEFRAMRGSHTGQVIADEIHRIFSEYNITHKVVAIVTDNASNMKRAITLMFPSDNEASNECDDDDENVEGDIDNPDLWQDIVSENEIDTNESYEQSFEDTMPIRTQRVPCFAHSIQLVVRDGLAKLGPSKSAMAKTCKLASMVHQSPLFKGSFEKFFGENRSIPAAVDTRWNSTFRQIKSVADLDQNKLTELLKEVSQEKLILSAKEIIQLRELIDILGPFCEATDMTQGDKSISISCVVPIVLVLRRKLMEKQGKPSHYPTMVTALLNSLNERFHGLLLKLNLINRQEAEAVPTRDLSFDDDLYVCAAALDPKFGFRWIQDIDSAHNKESIRLNVTGLISLKCFS